MYSLKQKNFILYLQISYINVQLIKQIGEKNNENFKFRNSI